MDRAVVTILHVRAAAGARLRCAATCAIAPLCAIVIVGACCCVAPRVCAPAIVASWRSIVVAHARFPRPQQRVGML